MSFFADISSEMIYPLIPLFLVGVLGAPTLALGLIEGVAQAIVSLMSAISGTISDRSGKRVAFVRWGYGLPILGKALISIAGSWQFVLVGRTIDRFGKGLRGSPRDVLIADAVPPNRRGEAFGFHRMMDTAGALVGVLIAAGCLWLLQLENLETVYRTIFAISAVLAFCSLAVSFFVVDPQSSSASLEEEPAQKPTFRVAIQGLGREYWVTLSILSVFAFANSSDAFLLLRAADVGLSALQVVLIYALYNLSYSMCSFSAGKLSDRHGRWKIISLGWLIYAVIYAGMAVTNSYFIWILFGVYGLYMALTEGVSKALIVDCVPAHKKGTAIGILYMALGLSALSSNIIAGYLWDSVGKSAPFWVGSLSAVVAILTVLFSGRLTSKATIQIA